jgi:uncharacterized membrane protein (UPF0127 family)
VSIDTFFVFRKKIKKFSKMVFLIKSQSSEKKWKNFTRTSEGSFRLSVIYIIREGTTGGNEGGRDKRGGCLLFAN